MLVKGVIGHKTTCDICEKETTKDGVVARGATGRYCVVLSCCKACANERGFDRITVEGALIRIEENQDGWADF